MNQQQNVPITPQPVSGGNEQIMAIVAIVVGAISLCGFFLPIIGVPLGVVGIVLGYLGRKNIDYKNLATVGMALSIVGIVLSCVPVVLIATMRLLGPRIGDTFSTISNSLP